MTKTDLFKWLVFANLKCRFTLIACLRENGTTMIEKLFSLGVKKNTINFKIFSGNIFFNETCFLNMYRLQSKITVV